MCKKQIALFLSNQLLSTKTVQDLIIYLPTFLL